MHPISGQLVFNPINLFCLNCLLALPGTHRLRLYFNPRGLAKLQIAVARGKKLHDKRQALARREADREADRAMARGRRR